MSVLRSALRILLIVIALALGVNADCFAQGGSSDHPANFIFLIDVSGSMLYKKEMVPGPSGEKEARVKVAVFEF